MLDQQLSDLGSEAFALLDAKNEALYARYPLSDWARFHCDDERRTLDIYKAGESLPISVQVVFIGSYSERLDSWCWGWANDSLSAAAREESAVLKELQGVTGSPVFRQEFMDDLTLGEAIKLSAIAVQHLGALGSLIYSSDPKVFVAVMGVRSVVQ